MKKLLFLMLTVIFMATNASAQSRTVTGQVLFADDDSPLPGATVLPVGSGNGVATDLDGKFTITVAPTVTQLAVSYIGMQAVKVKITNTPIIVKLSASVSTLDDVVVTAMGVTRSEKSLGYAATSVSGDEIVSARTSTVMDALQGKVAGLQIQSTSSDPGSSTNVTIRGLGSINSSNQPLYIVDGVPLQTNSYSDPNLGHSVSTGGISNISPDDIESLTVLKGAAATALYGSRAANGVILVTTKSGKKGLNKSYTISYSGGVEASRVSMLPEFQNSYGLGWNGLQTFIENGSWGPKLDGSTQVYGPVYNNSQLIHEYTAKKNNVKDFFDTGWSQNHNVAISGKSHDDDMSYYLSYGYNDNNGIMPGDGDSFKRNTFVFSGSYQPEKWVKISSNVNFSTFRTKTVASYQGVSVIDGLLEMPRDVSIVDFKDLSNPFANPYAWYTPYGITNPYWALANNYWETNGKQVFGKIQADINPIPEITLTYRFGFNYSDNDTKIGSPQIVIDDTLMDNNYGYSYTSMDQSGYVNASYLRRHELNHDFLAQYNKKFLDSRLDVLAIAGANINEQYSTTMGGQTDDLTFYTGFWQLSNGANRTSLYESQSKRRSVGVFADVSLGWDDFLFLDATGRNDWSSTLPIDNNSYFYPGVTVSGIFTRFLRDKSILSFGKVRLAYGRTGNDASPYYTGVSYIQAYTNGYYASDIISFPFNGVNAFMASNTVGSNTLKPEMTDEFEAGLNLKFFNGRIDLDAAYYHRTTSDQIFTLPVDPSTGFGYQVVNFGKVLNQGVELMLNTTPVQTRDWRWDLGFNFALNRNKVLEVPESLEGGRVTIYSFDAGNDAVYMYAEKGRALGEYYTYLPQYVTDKDSPYYGHPIVGSDGQPVLSADTEDTGYNMNHKWTGGVTTSLSWKGITLSAALDVRYGGKMFSRTKNLMQFVGNSPVTTYNDRRPFIIPGSVVDNGDGTYSPNTTPIYVADGSYQSYFNYKGWGNGGEAYLIDRSYTKLRNLSLTWELPLKWVQAAYLSRVSLTAYANNLFVWTAKDNLYVDPETSTTTSSSALTVGFGELYSNPSSRQFGMNLNITF